MIIVFGLIALALYITSFVMAGRYMDQTEDWNIIKTELRKVWIISVVASITLFMAISTLYTEAQARDRFMYVMLLIGCMSMGFAYCALTISMISK
jgi:uncharacterized membrane protein YoaT (DUF817 family)